MDPEEKDSIKKRQGNYTTDEKPFVDPEARPIAETAAPTTPTQTDMAPVPTPVKLSRKDRKELQDKEALRVNAQRYGVDIDNPGKEELTDDYANRIKAAVSTAGGEGLATKISGFADMLTPPPKVAAIKPDMAAQLDAEKRQRRARFGDALYAFGEGLQGKTANPDNFVSNRIQRNQDKQFQDYKDATEKNAATKWAWENKNTNDVMDWVDQQLKEENISQDRKDNLERIRDQMKQNAEHQNKVATETERHNRAMEIKPTGAVDKTTLPVTVRTEDGTDHTMTPVEADFAYNQAISHPEILKDNYDGFFTKTNKLDKRGRAIPGEFSYNLKPNVDRKAVIKGYLESQNNQKSSTPVLDKIKAEQAKVQSKTPTAQPAKKADSLGLGL